MEVCEWSQKKVACLFFSPHPQAFSTPTHPLGVLMGSLEQVFKDSYAGIGANRYLLPQAIAETHSLIKRLYGIVRSAWAVMCVHLLFSVCCHPLAISVYIRTFTSSLISLPLQSTSPLPPLLFLSSDNLSRQLLCQVFANEHIGF